MFESVNIHSSVAVFIQIENQVQFAIASSALKAGDQLPSVQELAQKVGVNVNTVAKAYRDLVVMGYLSTRRGMGVFVNKGIEGKCRDECRKRIAARVREVAAEAKATGMSLREMREAVDRSYASNAGPYVQSHKR